mmetsp:Transcript_2930/g.13194  ORF Transcript_2930/g.13194 Transcript_2930/m.13194 type:complete len:313 (-) Transcript_2930:462-1400(-)
MTALMTVARRPPFSSSCTARMVVPPGEQTLSLSSPGCDPVSNTIFDAPMTVWAARRLASTRGRPAATPPSASASMNWKTYAGPEPETPTTASMSLSGTTTHSPQPRMSRTTESRSAAASMGSAGSSPTHAAEAAAPTMQGVLGITRTTLGADFRFSSFSASFASSFSSFSRIFMAFFSSFSRIFIIFFCSLRSRRSSSVSTGMMVGSGGPTDADLASNSSRVMTPSSRRLFSFLSCLRFFFSSFIFIFIPSSMSSSSSSESESSSMSSIASPWSMTVTRISFMSFLFFFSVALRSVFSMNSTGTPAATETSR